MDIPFEEDYEYFELNMQWSKSAGQRLICALVHVWGRITMMHKHLWPNGEIAGVDFMLGIPRDRKDEFLKEAALPKYSRFRKASEAHVCDGGEGK
jgi:hypothetical protein